MENKELINRIKKGDPAAQRELYMQFKHLWFTICLRYNKNHSDAEDALQNALIKIFMKLDQFDDAKGAFKDWSSRIVVNENLMLLRKNTSQQYISPIEDELKVYDESEDAIDILSAEELTYMIQAMPAGYRTVFNMYIIDGYSHIEISKHLNISVNTSKSQLFKARKYIQQQLESVLL